MATTAVSESEVGKARDARDACGSRVRELTSRQAELAVAIDDASDAIKRFQGNESSKLRVLGSVGDTHSTAAEFLDNAVVHRLEAYGTFCGTPEWGAPC